MRVQNKPWLAKSQGFLMRPAGALTCRSKNAAAMNIAPQGLPIS